MTQQNSVQTILVVEPEAFIALDVAHVFRRAGAEVTMAGSVAGALKLIEERMWSAVIVGPTVDADECSRLCGSVKARDIPIVLYTRSRMGSGACHDAARVSMPAGPTFLVQAVERLLGGSHWPDELSTI